MTDDTARFYSKNIYTNLEENEDFLELFRDYVSHEEIKVGRLEQAPYADNFVSGLSIIKGWINSSKLELPDDSIVYKQLKEIR